MIHEISISHIQYHHLSHRLYPSVFDMAPKTHFTIPLGNTVDVVTHTQRGVREVRTTDKVVSRQTTKKKTSGKTSGARSKAVGHTETPDGQGSRLASNDSEETHTLQSLEEQEDAIEMEDPEDDHSQSNVSSIIHCYLDPSLILSQTPMDQWLQLRVTYLRLILDMEGLTKASKCSCCGKTMEIKCSNCLGGNYFCKACCIESHSRTPFHWMSRWTGEHFAPVSLYSLGFKLCLGHDGAPCPSTVEVCLH